MRSKGNDSRAVEMHPPRRRVCGLLRATPRMGFESVESVVWPEVYLSFPRADTLVCRQPPRAWRR